MADHVADHVAYHIAGNYHVGDCIQTNQRLKEYQMRFFDYAQNNSITQRITQPIRSKIRSKIEWRGYPLIEWLATLRIAWRIIDDSRKIR